MANWQSFVIQVPGKDLLEPVRNVLETLLVFLDVLKAILDTIKVFLIDFGNPIKALVEALIRLIEELFLSLKATGIFAYFDVPDVTKDPNFSQFAGGFPAFLERFKASLYDPMDFNRPQPRVGSTQSGFVLLVVDAANPFALIDRVKTLLRFFGREFTSPRYEAPDNLRALPVGDSGDPILAVASVFTDGPIEAIQLQWSLPTSLETPDPGFSDVVTKVAKEFVPPKFLIEKSVINPASQKIDIAELQTQEAAGTTEFDRLTFVNVGSRVNQPVKRRETLRDEFGDPVVKFQKYILIDELGITSILGQLGRFRYIDSDVEAGVTYFYRVRALSGDLQMQGDQITFPTVTQLSFSIESNTLVMRWPATSLDEAVVMGKPSGIVSATVPDLTGVENFEVVANLRALFLTSFTLDFHLQGDSFDVNGQPTVPQQIGRGSMTNLAGGVAAFESSDTIATLTSTTTVNQSFAVDPITGQPPEMPWQQVSLRKQSARLADQAASSMLQAGAQALEGFRDIMQGTLPAGPISVTGNLTGVGTLEGLVLNFTAIDADGNVGLAGAQTFVAGYADAGVRLNVLAGIQYVKTYMMGGAPVDWISVVPLRDIVPWSGQLIYDLLDKIRALLDAFNGVIDEINAFIAMLERKIEALERFIEFLINILNLIESLQLGAFILSVPELNGTAQSWLDAIDTAGGNPPPSGPGGFAAGVSFAYVGTDITAFKTAFSLIFG